MEVSSIITTIITQSQGFFLFFHAGLYLLFQVSTTGVVYMSFEAAAGAALESDENRADVFSE